jgi:hypothetical protein
MNFFATTTKRIALLQAKSNGQALAGRGRGSFFMRAGNLCKKR